jgi:hypothetical protein
MEQADRVLGAASLLGTVVALLYSLWYPSLQEAAGVSGAADPASRRKQADSIKIVFRTRAVPLAVASCLPAIVFLPVVTAVVLNGVATIAGAGIVAALQIYDAVQAAFVTVYLLTVGLAALAAQAAWSVRKRAVLISRP